MKPLTGWQKDGIAKTKTNYRFEDIAQRLAAKGIAAPSGRSMKSGYEMTVLALRERANVNGLHRVEILDVVIRMPP